jgi:alpha-tubulin suppressor-like RCC1 family protein
MAIRDLPIALLVTLTLAAGCGSSSVAPPVTSPPDGGSILWSGTDAAADAGRDVPLTPPPATTAIAAGALHTCALIAGGTVRCWGSNTHGELGLGTTTDALTPAVVPGVSGAQAVATGGDDTCIVTGAGGVQCWGANDQGQLGNGSTADATSPVTVPGLASVQAVTLGQYHACALLAGGTVQCWGWNYDGETGVGADAGQSTPTPAVVPGLAGVQAIAAGYRHTCALLSGGNVACWGDNENNQIGDGTTVNAKAPVPVIGVSGVTAIGAGGDHTCVVVAGGAVQCWGDNEYGELGDPALVTPTSRAPVTVGNVSGASALALGDHHTCALLAGGVVKCWGDNRNGALGGQDAIWTAANPAARPVAGLDSPTALASGTGFGCALLSGGAVDCWGAGGRGQLGDGSTADALHPVAVIW